MKRLISSRNIKVVLAIVLAITCINGIGLNLNDYPIQVPDGTSSSQSKTTSTSSIPDYTGLASVVLSDGSGLDISDLPSEIVLSKLDSLGRCGTVDEIYIIDRAGEYSGPCFEHLIEIYMAIGRKEPKPITYCPFCGRKL